jgi:hypothetical protein
VVIFEMFTKLSHCEFSMSIEVEIELLSVIMRYSLKGIAENWTFSVNIPSVDQIEVSDY